MKPAIGKIVWLHTEVPAIVLPAIIVGVNENGTINVQVFPNAPMFSQYVMHSMFFPNLLEGTEHGRWSWPEET
jgi:hypothetical protein